MWCSEPQVPSSTKAEIVVLATNWNPRALLRAQLIENGFDVVATDTWPMMRRYLRPGSKPALVIVDLRDLDNAADILRDLRVLMKPRRVLVLTALGTMSSSEIESFGFRAVARPIAIKDVVAFAARAIRETEETESTAKTEKRRNGGSREENH
jgi:DNA-binding NtrC family response regulator